MTGSAYLPIVVPIVAFVAMACWLGMVFYANSHPGYRTPKPRGSKAGSATERAQATHPAQATERAEAGERALTGGRPGDHERIDAPAASGALR